MRTNRFFLLILMLVRLSTLTAQSVDVAKIEARVVAIHEVRYPTSGTTKWGRAELNGQQVIEASLEVGGRPTTVIYNASGEVLIESTKLSYLPQTIKAHLTKRLGNYELQSAKKVKMYDRGSVQYVVEIIAGNNKYLEYTYDKAFEPVISDEIYAMGD